MVFFSCGSCGDSMKKNQVEKHCATKCRHCEFLSCVDCGKEFWGNDYVTHNKCISEEEKSHGSLYKKDPNANKGEQKQDLWTQQVLQAIAKAKGNQKLTNILENLKSYSNIPRKKAKFENFVKNSLRIHDTLLLSQAWEAISAEAEKRDVQESNGNVVTAGDKQEMNGDSDKHETQVAESNKMRRKKRKADPVNNCEPELKKTKNSESAVEDSDPVKWKSLIVEVLEEAPENKLSLKKLRKKFVTKLKAKQELNFTKEEIVEKLSKKLSKCSRVNISEDVVSLLER